MKPTKCECGMFIAPQLRNCPRCDKRIMHPNAEDAKEAEREAAEAAQAKLDSDAKRLDAKKLKWVCSARAHENIKERFKAQLKRRTVSKSEFHWLKQAAKASRVGRWSWEVGPHGHTVYISAKGRKYAEARSNERADLLLDYGTRDRGGWYYARPQVARLKRFENSHLARMAKKTEKVEKERVKAKKEKRKQKKLAKRQSSAAT